ncbi:tRNA (cytosine(72)-C(5))-methyltransferase NSUN6 isoform X2 [Galleria mellonella]|uniref:tRNA (Cytosine(72)-C(5))-methyltransferase NSUN6 isoform X2 n=1 Tax=Galleria mellonella TaxID=7137 RepID=A0ABM3MPH4_GALME|nr:tRNA (cytosine(72)-C(5))-methyltransferase NSUN6 isoform X2 [Galleria mellonella]
MKEVYEWLTKPPKYTIFRVNKLKQFNCEELKKIFITQSKKLNINEIPNIYFLKPDCLIIEQWSSDIQFENAEKEIIVDVSCAAAVLRGAHVFAPGVMGLPANLQLGERVDIYADMDGQCKRGLKVKYNGKKMYVGTGYLKMLRCDLFDKGVQPSGIAVETLLPGSRLPVINETFFNKGEVLLQNLPSIVCGWVVNAQPKEYILDMCAAPGNKTTHLAEMSDNQAIIIAIDKTAQKVDRIRENCEKHDVTCVHVYAFDSTKCYYENSEGIQNGPPYPSNCFDKILLDAPCSGLGQRPQLVNKMTPKMLQSYKFVQRKLIITAAELLKVGGVLIYSTCTVTEDENEGMVAWTLDKIPCLNLIPAEPLLGGPGLPNCGLDDSQRGNRVEVDRRGCIVSNGLQ